MTQPTPTPWRLNMDIGRIVSSSRDVLFVPVGATLSAAKVNEANARLIVRAVNSHAAVVAALERALPFIDDAMDAHTIFHVSAASDKCREVVAEARAALALATEGEG